MATGQDQRTKQQEDNSTGIQLSITSKFDLNDVFVIGESNLSYNKYYQENIKSYKNNQLGDIKPFLTYYHLQCMKNELHVKNGTQELHLDQLLDFKMRKEVQTNNSTQKHDYESIKKHCLELLENVKDINNELFPCSLSVAERKMAIRDIKDVMFKYIFIHKCLTLISPPIKEEALNVQFNFIKCNKILRHEKFRRHYPIYPISFDSLAKFLKRTFGLKKESIALLKNIISLTPFYWPKISAYKETEADVVQYDKALYLLSELFLKPSHLDVITETLLVTNSFERIGLADEDSTEISTINYLICNTRLNNITQRSYRMMMIAPFDGYNYDLNEFIEKQSFLKYSMVNFKIKRQGDGSNSRIIIEHFEDATTYCTENTLNLTVDKDYDINTNAEPILMIKAKINKIDSNLEKLIIYTTERKIKLSSGQYNKEHTYKKVLKPEYLIDNIYIFTKDNKINGIFCTLNTEEPIQDFDVLKQQRIVPSDFDLLSLNDLKLRFDITYFSKAQLEKYSNSISIIKYDVNAYTRNVNYVIDFLESLFLNCSTVCNAIEPFNIGEFRVFVLGINNNGKFVVNSDKRNSSGTLKRQEVATYESAVNINRYDLFKNTSDKSFPEIENLYFNICELILQHSEVSLLVEKQLSFLHENNMATEECSRNRIEEEMIDVKEQTTSVKRKPATGIAKCVNYTCGKDFEHSNNELCTGHTGTWDFGHTGITIEDTLKEYNKEKSSKVLWKPHWTCCGRKWEEACSAIHKHVSSEMDPGKRFEIDTNTKECQKWFKKNIRKTWISQLNKFHRLNEYQVKEKIKMFAARKNIKMNAIPMSSLAALCDYLNMHLLVISDDMSYHFKLLDLINKKAFKYLDDGSENIDVGKFIKWWFADLKQLDEFALNT